MSGECHNFQGGMAEKSGKMDQNREFLCHANSKMGTPGPQFWQILSILRHSTTIMSLIMLHCKNYSLKVKM